MAEAQRRAVFFDRDGTLIRDQGYAWRPEKVELCPGAARAVRDVREMGYVVVVITNQSGVARGFFDEDTVAAVHRRMAELLGAAPDAVYSCFHFPGGIRPEYALDCDCRKPKPGMLLRAERELGVALAESILVGDSIRDLAAGRAAGARTVLIRGGSAEEYVRAYGTPSEADYVAEDLASAVSWIRSRSSERARAVDLPPGANAKGGESKH